MSEHPIYLLCCESGKSSNKFTIDQKFMSANAVQSFPAGCEIYNAIGHFI